MVFVESSREIQALTFCFCLLFVLGGGGGVAVLYCFISLHSATKLSSAKIEVEEKRMRAMGDARSMQILARAEADRIRTLDEAMSKICDVTMQRELIRSTGDALEKGKSSIMLGNSFVDVTRMLGNMAAAEK